MTFVADQLGHANPQITLRIYARLFDPASRREEAREKLQARFGDLVGAGKCRASRGVPPGVPVTVTPGPIWRPGRI